MARNSNATARGTRTHGADPAADEAGDPAGSPADSSSSQGAGDGAAPPKKRKRGPNKPKPGTFIVETNARMQHEEIIKLLTAHAIARLGPDVAARMVLQVHVDGRYRPLNEILPQGATLQFATEEHTPF